VHFGPKTLMTADEHEANATHALHIAEALRARGVDAADVDVDAVMRGSDGDASLVFAASTYQEGAYDTVWPPVGVLLGVLEVTSGSLDVRVNGDPDKVPPGMYAVRADRPNKLRLEHALDPKKDLVVDASKHNALPDKVALKCACFLSCCVGDC